MSLRSSPFSSHMWRGAGRWRLASAPLYSPCRLRKDNVMLTAAGQAFQELFSFSATAEGYGDFLCELFDLWWENRNQGISIRLFDAVLECLVYGRPSLCVFSPVCEGYLVVEHDGSVYPCDFFVREDTHLDDLIQKPLNEIFHSPAYRCFGKRKSVFSEECRSCQWLSLCWGGCQKDRVDEQGRPAAKTFFCRSYRQFFSHTMPRFLSLAKELQASVATSPHGQEA